MWCQVRVEWGRAPREVAQASDIHASHACDGMQECKKECGEKERECCRGSCPQQYSEAVEVHTA